MFLKFTCLLNLLGVYGFDYNTPIFKSGSFVFTPLDLQSIKLYENAWFGFPKNFTVYYAPEAYRSIIDSKLDLNTFYDKFNHNFPTIQRFVSVTYPYADNSEYYTLLYRYGLCYYNFDREANCPNPCNLEPCANIRGTLGCIILPSYEDNVDMIKAGRLVDIFKIKYQCSCKIGYFWNQKECKLIKEKCSRDSVCNNGGTCIHLNADHYKCLCLPAFTGPHCEATFNPCTHNRLCGSFECVRNPSNVQHGYSCSCGTNYEPDTHSPVCVDRNECKTTPCLNGGSCANTYGGYVCNCTGVYAGENCEQINPSLQDFGQWTDWSEWSSCSSTCEVEGEYQESTRHCRNNIYCGSSPMRRVRSCEAKLKPCTELSIYFRPDTLQHQMNRTVDKIYHKKQKTFSKASYKETKFWPFVIFLLYLKKK